MNNLITVSYSNDGTPRVLGRDLHKALEVETRYNDWFQRMREYGFEEGKDFYSFLSTSKSGRTLKEHWLTVETAKEICMLQRNEKGKQVRAYFLELEKRWHSPEFVMARALEMANSTITELTSNAKALTEQIEADKPKVVFADAVSGSEDSILVGELAKLITQNGVNIGPLRLFEWLRENGYLMRRKTESHNLPTQRSMERGLFEIKETVYRTEDGRTATKRTPKVTGKGQLYFVKRFVNEKIEKQLALE